MTVAEMTVDTTTTTSTIESTLQTTPVEIGRRQKQSHPSRRVEVRKLDVRKNLATKFKSHPENKKDVPVPVKPSLPATALPPKKRPVPVSVPQKTIGRYGLRNLDKNKVETVYASKEKHLMSLLDQPSALPEPEQESVPIMDKDARLVFDFENSRKGKLFLGRILSPEPATKAENFRLKQRHIKTFHTKPRHYKKDKTGSGTVIAAYGQNVLTSPQPVMVNKKISAKVTPQKDLVNHPGRVVLVSPTKISATKISATKISPTKISPSDEPEQKSLRKLRGRTDYYEVAELVQDAWKESLQRHELMKAVPYSRIKPDDHILYQHPDPNKSGVLRLGWVTKVPESDEDVSFLLHFNLYEILHFVLVILICNFIFIRRSKSSICRSLNPKWLDF